MSSVLFRIFGSMLLLAALVSARPSQRKAALSEDSLQTLVSMEPENPAHWINLGTLAAQHGQVDLAKGYFDEAIKLTGRTGKTILQIGNIWLAQGRIKASLPYLMPNLGLLDSAHLETLQEGLEKEKMASVQLIVLRHLCGKSSGFNPVTRKTAVLAFQLGEFALCQSLLSKSIPQLDFESARNLLLVNFFLGTSMDAKAMASIQAKYSQGEIIALCALNNAMLSRWREARAYLKREAKSASYRDYYSFIQAMEAAADERHEEAALLYEKALGTAWDRLKVAVYADLYRFYSQTGNKFKSDQVWESLKEEYQDKDTEIQEFMALQLQVRGYEKQSKYFYRMVLRKRPGNAEALGALWEDMLGNEDYQGISDNVKAILDKDPLSCAGNTLAMNYHFRQGNEKELLPYARNATIYCYETVEPYYILGNTLLNMSKPDEARVYFSTYIRKGGDANKVPMNLR